MRGSSWATSRIEASRPKPNPNQENPNPNPNPSQEKPFLTLT